MRPFKYQPPRFLFASRRATRQKAVVNRWILFLWAWAVVTTAQPTAPERPVVPAAAAAAPVYHVVRPGDSLSKIGKSYGVRVEELRRANHLTGDLIAVGRKLLIPVP